MFNLTTIFVLAIALNIFSEAVVWFGMKYGTFWRSLYASAIANFISAAVSASILAWLSFMFLNPIVTSLYGAGPWHGVIVLFFFATTFLLLFVISVQIDIDVFARMRRRQMAKMWRAAIAANLTSCLLFIAVYIVVISEH